MEIVQVLLLFLLWLSGVICGMGYSYLLANKITRKLINKYYTNKL